MKKNKGLQRIKRRKHVGKRRNRNARVAALKMKIKKGDKVMVVSGKDKGKTGEVLNVFPKANRVVVEGVAIAKRSLRKTGNNQSGRIVERPMPIHASNVMVLDPESKKPTRVYREMSDGKRVRMSRKGKTVIK